MPENQFSREKSSIYREYMWGESGRGSSSWLFNRELRLQHNRWTFGLPTCERCRRPVEKLDVHHKNYNGLRGHTVATVDKVVEAVEDLGCFCRLCHEVIDVEAKGTAHEAAVKVMETLPKYTSPRCRTWSEWLRNYDPVVTGRGPKRRVAELETDVEALFENAI